VRFTPVVRVRTTVEASPELFRGLELRHGS
jgi:hypothetical protein